MSTPAPTSGITLIARTRSITRIDRRPLNDLPKARMIALAGAVAIAASLAADVILVALGRGAFHPPVSFGQFSFATYAPLTIIGVIGATAFWAALVHVTSQPRWVLLRAAIAVTAVLLVPDFLLLPNNPAGGVITLMAMHLAIAVVTAVALLRIAPARGQERRVSKTAAADSSVNA